VEYNTLVTKCLIQNSRGKKSLKKTHVRREGVRKYVRKVRNSVNEQYVTDALIILCDSAQVMSRMSCTPLQM
jgi:hypothetical protein